MTKILEGVRILEVAEHTFVPAASAALADLGAEVIKIEHVTRGDAMRGLASTGVGVDADRCPRPARALQPRQAEPRPRPHPARRARHPLPARRHVRRVPHQQAADRARRSCRSTSTTSAPHNPNIIYVRGSGQGDRGPDADKGSYDSLAYWARAGIAYGAKRPEIRRRADAAGARRSATRSARSRSPGRSWARCSTASAPARRPSSTSRCSPPACGRWARRWRCRSCSASRGRRRRPTVSPRTR